MPKTKKKLTVAITGAAGYVGGLLIRSLSDDDRVERILAFDVRPPAETSPKLVFDRLDVRNPALEARLAGVDVLVHLAFIMDPIKDEALMRDVNVGGSQNVFHAAGRAGVGKIVYTSSAVVYGAHPDNDFPLTEDSPLRANLDFSYPAHKLEVEYVIREFRSEFPKVKVAVMRPAIVFGPHVDSAWAHMLETPVLVAVRGYAPPFQFVHEDDVADALVFAIHNDVDGAYNLAPSDHTTSDEAEAILGRRRRELAEPTAFAMAEKLWRMGMSEVPPGVLHYVMHPWIVSPAKLAAAGFSCKHSSTDTYRQVATAARANVRLGKARLRRSTLKRGALAGAGVATTAEAMARARARGAR